MKSTEVRNAFLRYFEENGHRIVPSSSLIPYHDPTILFANAGMNQFKDTFLGREQRPYRRATSSQKCMRVSGKHNDFEDVGRSYRHHTFFEMLGNFSFGDYFKTEAIRFAWELITEKYGLPKDRLYVTVYEKDDEAYDLWSRVTDVRKDRMYRFGEKDNFWAMGETGPCGPCSEIHYDFGQSPLGHTDCDLDCSCGRYVELWNLVFMQYNRDDSGTMTPLPAPSIDTGMGLERITTVLQGKVSNYDSDLFMPLIEYISQLASIEYRRDAALDVSMRIIADHARAAAFLVADGQYPGNDKRGYVLRKILRRAIAHGRKLGLEEPFLFRVANEVTKLMATAYPELGTHQETMNRIIRGEEEAFSQTLGSGLKEFQVRVEALKKKGEKIFPGSEAFFLYDTHGLPLETVKELSAEHNLIVDESEFHARMEQQRDLSRQSQEGGKAACGATANVQEKSCYTGHQSMSVTDARIVALFSGEESLDRITAGQEAWVILDRTPFYSESGGQVGDQGLLRGSHGCAQVKDTKHYGESAIGHLAAVGEGVLQVGDQVEAAVDCRLRRATQRNHTATHLLHAALRQVLGEHVKQAGSMVSPDRLRFDFSHFAALTADEIRRIEDIVNQNCLENRQVKKTAMKLEEATATGAMALFGEKYQETVTVVDVDGVSRELCGGTHIDHTGEIGLFKILSESSISAGIRRIEATTGTNSLEYLRKADETIDEMCSRLKIGPEGLPLVLERTLATIKDLQRKTEELQLKLGKASAGNLLDKVRDVAGVPVLTARVEGIPKDGLRDLADQLRTKVGDGVVVLGCAFEGKANLVAMIGGGKAQKVHASKLIKEIAPIISGGGGGKADLAEAGGKNPEAIDMALEKSIEAVQKQLQS